ncbi:MAG: hypothetical protein ABIQ57_04590 [Candidatus Kapaibacterium sp.]
MRVILIRFFLFLSIALLVSAIPATAQDIRLSAEPIKPVVSTGSRVQAAARIGDLSLAIFGTDIDQPGDPVGILRMQLLRDTLPFGNQKTITTPDARPSGWVQVIPMRDHFMVLWNDHRGTSWAVYLCNIDTMGNVSREERFLDHPMNRIGILSLQTSSGYLLLWNDSSGVKTIQACTLDSSGKFLTTPHRYADGEFRGAIYPAITTTLAILDRGEPGPLPIDRSGRIVPLPPGALNKFSGIYFLGDDGSVLTNRRDTIREYHSVFDSVPFHSEIIRLPADAIAGTEIVSRDAAGRMQICYAVGGGYMLSSVGGGILPETIRRVTRLGLDRYSEPDRLNDLEIYSTYDVRINASAWPISSTVVRGPDNSYSVAVRFKGTTFKSIQGTSYNGVIDCIRTYITNPYNRSTDSLPLTNPAATTGIYAFESANLTGREIDIACHSGLAQILAPAPFREVPLTQRSPVVADINGNITVGWFVIGADSVAEVGRWNGDRNAPVTIVDRLLFDDSLSPHGYLMRNALIATEHQIFLGLASWATRPGGPNHQRYRLFTLAAQGWNKLADITEHRAALQWIQMALSVSPDRSFIGLALGHTLDGSLYWWRPVELRILDTAGIERRRIDSIRINLVHEVGIALLNPNNVRAIGDATSIRILGDTTIHDTIGFASQGAQYRFLSDNLILRSHIANAQMWIDMFDSTDSLVRSSGPLKLAVSNPDYFIARNPIDSGFAIVYGGSSGVKMIVLDKHLALLRDTIISETRRAVGHPCAAFRGNDLYIVWEDSRNGNPDIYGTTAVVPTHAARRNRDPIE